MELESIEYQQGFNAFCLADTYGIYLSKDENPYSPGSGWAYEWERGRFDAAMWYADIN